MDNEITFDSTQCRNVVFKSEDAEIVRGQGWIECRPRRRDSVCIVAWKNIKGRASRIERFYYVVEKLPYPKGLKWGNQLIRDTLSKGILLLSLKMEPYISDDARNIYVLQSFRIEAAEEFYQVYGNTLTSEAKALIRKLPLGSRIKFLNVIIAGGSSMCSVRMGDFEVVLR